MYFDMTIAITGHLVVIFRGGEKGGETMNAKVEVAFRGTGDWVKGIRERHGI